MCVGFDACMSAVVFKEAQNSIKIAGFLQIQGERPGEFPCRIGILNIHQNILCVICKMLRMTRFNQRSQHADYIMVKHPVIAILSYMKFISVRDNQHIDVTCLVGIDQLCIFLRNRLNIDNLFQSGIPIILHMIIMFIEITLSSQNCIFRISVTSAEPVRTNTIFPNYGFTCLNLPYILRCIVQRNQITADSWQKLDLIIVIGYGHAGISNLILLTVYDNQICKILDLVVHAVFAVLTDKARQISFCIIPVDRFGRQSCHAKSNHFITIIPKPIGSIHPGNGGILISFPSKRSCQTTCIGICKAAGSLTGLYSRNCC